MGYKVTSDNNFSNYKLIKLVSKSSKRLETLAKLRVSDFIQSGSAFHQLCSAKLPLSVEECVALDFCSCYLLSFGKHSGHVVFGSSDLTHLELARVQVHSLTYVCVLVMSHHRVCGYPVPDP